MSITTQRTGVVCDKVILPYGDSRRNCCVFWILVAHACSGCRPRKPCWRTAWWRYLPCESALSTRRPPPPITATRTTQLQRTHKILHS